MNSVPLTCFCVRSVLFWVYIYLISSCSGTKQLEDQIYREIRGRVKEDDISAPLRRGAYYYYKRTLEGKEYVQHCRIPVADIGRPVSVHDTMPTGPDAPPEHVILDENVKAQEHGFYVIGAFKARPNCFFNPFFSLIFSFVLGCSFSSDSSPFLDFFGNTVFRLARTINW